MFFPTPGIRSSSDFAIAYRSILLKNHIVRLIQTRATMIACSRQRAPRANGLFAAMIRGVEGYHRMKEGTGFGKPLL
jgi:hypothetical protein